MLISLLVLFDTVPSFQHLQNNGYNLDTIYIDRGRLGREE
jgi:hypothetical protein